MKCLTVHLTMDENFDLLVKKKNQLIVLQILVGVSVGVSKNGLADAAPTVLE